MLMLKSCNYVQLKKFEEQLLLLERKYSLPDYVTNEAERFKHLIKELCILEYTTVIKRKETQDVRVRYMFRIFVKEMKPFLEREVDKPLSCICKQWEYLFEKLGLSKRTDLAVRSPHGFKLDYRITIVLDDICLAEDLENRFFSLKK